MVNTQCKATAKSTGKPCQRPVVPGATVCRFHGGNAPQVRAKAQLRVVEAEVRELFGKAVPEPTPVDNPLAAYAELAGRVLAWMQLMDSLLDDLRAPGFHSANTGVQIAATVQLYERAMDRCNTVLGSYARLRIDDRLAAITERQADMVIRALDAVIAFCGATGPKAVEARKVGAAQLRIVGE